MANAFLFWTILALSDLSLNFNLFPTLSLSLEYAVSKLVDSCLILLHFFDTLLELGHLFDEMIGLLLG